MSNPTTQPIGQQIKTFRNKLGISQHDFEFNIGLSTGSLTKIESGKVTPSRETLLKIIEILELNAVDTFSILGVSPNKIAQVIELINEINLQDDIDSVCQMAINEIPKILGLLGGAVNIVYGDVLKTIVITQAWYTDLVFSIMPFKLNDFVIPMDDENNLMVRAIHLNEILYGNNVYEFTCPYMSKTTAQLIQNVANVETIVCIPMIIKNKLLGSAIYVKNTKTPFNNEIYLLETFNKSLATKIYNLTKFDT